MRLPRRFGCNLLTLVRNLLIKCVKPLQVRGRLELFYLHCFDPLQNIPGCHDQIEGYTRETKFTLDHFLRSPQ